MWLTVKDPLNVAERCRVILGDRPQIHGHLHSGGLKLQMRLPIYQNSYHQRLMLAQTSLHFSSPKAAVKSRILSQRMIHNIRQYRNLNGIARITRLFTRALKWEMGWCPTSYVGKGHVEILFLSGQDPRNRQQTMNIRRQC